MADSRQTGRRLWRYEETNWQVLGATGTLSVNLQSRVVLLWVQNGCLLIHRSNYWSYCPLKTLHTRNTSKWIVNFRFCWIDKQAVCWSKWNIRHQIWIFFLYCIDCQNSTARWKSEDSNQQVPSWKNGKGGGLHQWSADESWVTWIYTKFCHGVYQSKPHHRNRPTKG